MASNSNQAQRKEQQDELRKKQQEIFDRSLPMSREEFKKLFAYIKQKTRGKDNDNTLNFTKRFLIENVGEKGDSVLKWINYNGAYSDTEILFNIEELFD